MLLRFLVSTEMQRALASAMRTFKEGAMGDAHLQDEFLDKLQVALEDIYKQARSKCAAVSEKLATDMLQAESAKLTAMMTAPNADLDQIEVELHRCVMQCVM